MANNNEGRNTYLIYGAADNEVISEECGVRTI